MLKKIHKSYIPYLITTIFVVIFFFRQIVFYISPKIGYQLVGNLDIFYLIGLMYIVLNCKKISKIEVIGILILLAYPLLQRLPNPQYNFVRAYVNILKIIICYFTMRGTMHVIKKYGVQVKYGTILFGVLCAISLVVALILNNNPILWRLNDTINAFDLKRLKLFYTEPGELGMHCSIILIVASYIITKARNKLGYVIIAILPTLACLLLTKSLGGIAIGAIGVGATLISDLCLNFSKKKLITFGAIACSSIIAIIVAVMCNSGLYMRVTKVFSNMDSSSRYRITMAFEVTPKIMKDTSLLGTGFGNLELPNNTQKYHNYGLNSAGIINSFMNLIAESGVVGIMLICILIYILVVSCIYLRQPIAWGVTVFLLTYQFMGTYFTNPLLWVLYGFVLTCGVNTKNAKRSPVKKETSIKNPKLGVVIVTYNRQHLLKEAINACKNQTYPFEKIVIVNNASTDGTKSILAHQKGIETITLDKNIGGAGGFYEGINYLLKRDCVDYILLIDDDAIINKSYNSSIIPYMEKNDEGIMAFSGSVIQFKNVQYDHRRFVKDGFNQSNSTPDQYTRKFFDYDLGTFCGLYISANAIKQIGLPKKEYFIWFDDTEYSLRLLPFSKIRNVTAAKLKHKVNSKVRDQGYSWKSYYGIRNQFAIIKEYYPEVLWKYVTQSKIRMREAQAIGYIKHSEYYKNVATIYKDAIRDGVNSKMGINTKYTQNYNIGEK